MQQQIITLDDKYAAQSGRVFMTGVQALVRLPLDQQSRDHIRGLNTAGYISGYRGSPLGIYDQQLKQAQKFLDRHNIVFQEGLNEDLAATAIWGSQQCGLFQGARYEGVFGLWYGKAPGVDRAGDVFKHANFSGVNATGGVLAILGDDPTCKSSTLPSQSEYAMMDYEVPVLNPATVQEVLDYGLYGLAMSRFAGCWASMVATADTMDSGSVVEVNPSRLSIQLPDLEYLDAQRYIHRRAGRLEKECVHRQQRLPAALAFTRHNKMDKVVFGAPDGKIGIVTTGIASRDLFEALDSLGISEGLAKQLRAGVFKVALSWPLEPEAISEFCAGLDRVLVIEHKRPLIEDQLRALLYDLPKSRQPEVYGKRQPLKEKPLSDTYVMSVPDIARAVYDLLPDGGWQAQAQAYFTKIEQIRKQAQLREIGNVRQPYFCSGCPHNRSTKLPDGARAMAGIGCHFLASMHSDDTDMHTQMGGEGVPWLGLAPFTDEEHVFANLGDGTYSHSGSLAIRAAVAAGVNITYKLLYNDAVAMTGGQSPELSGRSVAHIITQLQAEAVTKIVVVTDEPARYKDARLPSDVSVYHRDELMVVQKSLQQVKGVSVLIYEQTCATEKRRRRKRKTMAESPARVFINKAVCENCGDCSVQSSCLSIEPTWTKMGLKRIINQSTCNQDMSCIKGFCPSFVSVYGGQVRQKNIPVPDFDSAAIALPLPMEYDGVYNILIAGIGGAGVTTISALLGMAAHIDGRMVTTLDSIGLAQKGGSVVAHVRIAQTPEAIRSSAIAPAGVDLVLGGDVIVSHEQDNMLRMNVQKSQVVMNTEIVPTMEYLSSRDLAYSKSAMLDDIEKSSQHMYKLNAQILAEQLLGDGIYTNMVVLGMAWQLGLVPLSVRAIRQAVKLNNVKVAANLAAFEAGRLWCHDPEALQAKLPSNRYARNPRVAPLQEVIDYRRDHLCAYQNAAYASRYTDIVNKVWQAEQELNVSDSATISLTREVAIQYARVLAYKDEYEVARLYTDGRFKRQLKAQFSDGYKLKLNFAPPIFNVRDNATDAPKKREFGIWIMAFLHILARFKFLRHTLFDLFGYSHERRRERSLITCFEQDVDYACTILNSNNHAKLIDLINSYDDIRGFGHIKVQAMDKAQVKADVIRQQLAQSLNG